MKHTKIISAALFGLFFTTNANAQLDLDAELVSRGEYRHGFSTLFPDNANPAAFVTQRTRLKTKYKADKLEFYLGLQDIRVWGDVAQLNSADANGLAVHQAWAKINLGNNFSIKSGRQEVIYDNHRIFGNVNWAIQARSHDLAIFKYETDSFKIDLGVAYNQARQTLKDNFYTGPSNYKTFQYIWLHKKMKDLSASVLFLNNGIQYDSGITGHVDSTGVRYSQTAGTHLEYKKNKLNLTANAYYQFGKDAANNDLNAYLIGLEAKYKTSEKIQVGLGGEIQSGNDNGAPSAGKNNAFTPFYGTNHKFNGWMDYFYVGNHGNNVGLVDLYFNIDVKLNKKSSMYLATHNFNTAADLPTIGTQTLGQEIDFVYTYKIQKDALIKIGYSQMFADTGMEVLKGNTDGNTNNWAWVMLVVKPNLFSSIAK